MAGQTVFRGRKYREIDDISSNSACAAGWGGDSHSIHGLSTPEAVLPEARSRDVAATRLTDAAQWLGSLLESSILMPTVSGQAHEAACPSLRSSVSPWAHTHSRRLSSHC
eukprot:366461-Chlamydomonas_euryale.AAC.2